jgi:hypothetical protein
MSSLEISIRIIAIGKNQTSYTLLRPYNKKQNKRGIMAQTPLVIP